MFKSAKILIFFVSTFFTIIYPTPIEIKTKSGFNKLFKDNPEKNYFVFKFSAEWCPGCKKFIPDYNKIAQDNASWAVFATLDVDEKDLEDLIKSYDIKSIPHTKILDKDKKVIFTLIGGNKDKLNEELNKLKQQSKPVEKKQESKVECKTEKIKVEMPIAKKDTLEKLSSTNETKNEKKPIVVAPKIESKLTEPKKETKEQAEVQKEEGIKEIIGNEDHAKVLEKENAVIKFYSENCPACRAFIPTFEEAASEYSDHFVFAQVDVNNKLNRELSRNVESIPTTKIYQSGEEVRTIVGADRKEFIKVLDELTSEPELAKMKTENTEESKKKPRPDENIKIEDNVSKNSLEKAVYPVIIQDQKVKEEKQKSEKKKDESIIREILGRDSLNGLLENPSKKPYVIEFFSHECTQCQMFKPTYEEFASSFSDRANFYKLDIDLKENDGIAEIFDIKSLPTTLIFEKSEIKATIFGPNRTALEKSLMQLKRILTPEEILLLKMVVEEKKKVDNKKKRSFEVKRRDKFVSSQELKHYLFIKKADSKLIAIQQRRRSIEDLEETQKNLLEQFEIDAHNLRTQKNLIIKPKIVEPPVIKPIIVQQPSKPVIVQTSVVKPIFIPVPVMKSSKPKSNKNEDKKSINLVEDFDEIYNKSNAKLSKVEFFEKMLNQSAKPVVIKFHFERKSIYCRNMIVPFDELAKKYPDISFIKINKETNNALKQKFSIKWYPTFLFFRKGYSVPEDLFKVIGMDKENLEKNVNRLINNN